MTRTSVKYEQFKFRKGASRLAFSNELRSIFYEGMVHWAVATANKVPVWSGEAMSSLIPVIDYINNIRFGIITAPVGVYVGPIKDASPSGLARRQRGLDDSDRGPYISQSANQYGLATFEFHWTITVEHWKHWEPAKWHAVESGLAALEKYVDSQLFKAVDILLEFGASRNA